MLKVSIVGAGWLGIALAKSLKNKHVGVAVSSTTTEKVKSFISEGYQAVDIDLDKAEEINPDFWGDILVLSFPPGKNGDYSKYLKRVDFLLKSKPAKVQRIILISSTSVYPKRDGDWKEDDAFTPDTESSFHIIEAEEKVLSSNCNSVILRLAGLVGYERNPARFGSSRLAANEPVNMIHRDDAVAAIDYFIHHPEHQGIYNLCAANHPSRLAFYEAGAMELKVKIPMLENSEKPLNRTINSEKIRTQTEFQFSKDDPLLFWK